MASKKTTRGDDDDDRKTGTDHDDTDELPTKPAARAMRPAALPKSKARAKREARENSPSNVPMKPQSLAALTAAVARVLSLCFDLHGDGRLSGAQQADFYARALRVLRLLDRFDGATKGFIDDKSLSADDIDATRGPVDAAITALENVKRVPSTQRLGAGRVQTDGALASVVGLFNRKPR